MEPKSVSQYTAGLKKRIESTESEWVRGEISSLQRSATHRDTASWCIVAIMLHMMFALTAVDLS